MVFFWQFIDFVAPAVFVGVFSASAAKLFWRRALRAVSWAKLLPWAVGPGVAASVAGLVLTGHDGRMLTYAGVVVLSAVGLWLRAFLMGAGGRA